MSMRSQVYEWANLAPAGSTSTLRRNTDDQPKYVGANVEYDLFIGGIGNNITKPAETTATQFIVIEDIAATPYLGGAVQVRINTTDYFQKPRMSQTKSVYQGSCISLPKRFCFNKWRNRQSFEVFRPLSRCLCATDGTGFPNSLLPKNRYIGY